MAMIIHLPDEIIALILEDENISMEDIVNLKSTCNRLQQITFSHKFWEKKFYQRFSFSERRHSEERLTEIFNHSEESIKCMEKLRHYVSLMSHSNLCGTKKKELNSLLRSIAEDSIIYRFILDDINRLVSTQLLLRHDSNLTVMYNFGLIYHWIKQYRLIYKQNIFMYMPKEKLLLERQLTIIIQYFLPYVTYSVIDTWLENIVQKVLSCLKAEYPKHSAFSLSSEQFSFWRENNINDNFWEPTESRQIMYIIQEIMFSETGAIHLCRLFETLDVKTKYIDYILRYYQEFLLTIGYHSIARRLGLRCFLHCGYDEGFVTTIVWESKYYTEGCQSAEFFYMMEKSFMYPVNIVSGSCSIMNPMDPLYDISQIQKIMLKLPHFCELINNHCNILHNLKVNNLMSFLSRCLKSDIEDIDIDYEYRNITNSIKDRVNIVRSKPEIKKKIKYTIGMMVTHSPKPYLPSTEKCNPHTGVIIGWNYKCKAAFVQKKLKSVVPHLSECCEARHMCFCKCYTYESGNSKFTYQPHYIILAENNIVCYAPQDTVSSCPPKWINNVEIGRYFSHFEGTHYVPTENLSKNYPTDIAIMREVLSDR